MTEEMTIEQQNVVIARFEGRLFFGKFPIDAYGPKTRNAYPVMKYHSSWEWLMPVVEKIRSLGYRVEIIIGVACDVFIYKIGGNPDTDKLNIVAYSNPQEAVYTAVAQFIKWYNAYIEKQPTTQNQGV